MRPLLGARFRRAHGVRLAARQVRRRDVARRSRAISSRRSSSHLAHKRAIAAYDQRESEYPVLAGLYRFSARGASGQRQGFLREDLVEWAKRRFDVELSVDDLKNKQREEIRAAAGRAQPARTTRRPTRSPPKRSSASTQLFADEPSADGDARHASPATTASSTISPTWLKRTCNANSRATSWRELDREAARRKVSQVVEDHFRPKCGGWSGRCCCRSSTRPGKSTCWRWTTCVQRRPARLRPGRSQGRVQARRHAAVRDDVDLGRQLRDRPDLQDGAARRRLRRQHVGRVGSDQGRRSRR